MGTDMWDWDGDVSISNKGPALPIELADRIDAMYEAIRRTRRSPVVDDDVVELLRGQVQAFSNLLVCTLRGMGYTCFQELFSYEVYLRLGNYTIDVWYSDLPQFIVRIRNDFYHLYHPVHTPLSIYLYQGQRMLGVQHLVATLYKVSSIMDAGEQCNDCYWSGEAGTYCGLGMVPEGSCSHRYSNEVITT